MKLLHFKSITLFIAAFFLFQSCEKENYQAAKSTNEIKKETITKSNRHGVSEGEAQQFALNFYNERFSNKKSQKIKNLKKVKVPIPGKKLYAAHMDPNGYIIMSDDKRNVPVFSFSENGSFDYKSLDDMPLGVKEWATEFLLMNLHLQSKHDKSQKENRQTQLWNTYLDDNAEEKLIIPEECDHYFVEHIQSIYDDCIMETAWGQGPPYNLLTPICDDDGDHTPAGCVAVAMAQVMNYWQHPDDFPWDVMKNYYSSDEISRSAYETAGLMKNIGDNVSMNYGCDGSSASLNKAKKALVNDYGYNHNIVYDDYRIDDIKNNIQFGYPVILGGYRTIREWLGITIYLNGHAWVADGYWLEYDRYKEVCYTGGGVPIERYYSKNHQYYIHMNWGWSNGYGENTWYYSNELTAPDNGTGNNYQWNKSMIINIHP